MFGFAVNETPELMPLPIKLAHLLTARLEEARVSGELPYLRPDGKSQVTVEYNEQGKPLCVETVVVSTQHSEEVEHEQLYQDVFRKVIMPVLGGYTGKNMNVLINPTGKFVIGGPQGDAGLTGRKIIVDTYGGGAFSGKDPSKVDRSAAYAARYIAKNLVEIGLAHACEVQLAYAIGVAEPVSVLVNTFGTGKRDDLDKLVRANFPLKPKDIIEHFDLKRPIYQETASHGHFGRSRFPWEKTDKFLMRR